MTTLQIIGLALLIGSVLGYGALFLWVLTVDKRRERRVVPIDTGNLRYNATSYKSTGELMCRILVDGAVAPYAVYTNEPWLSPRWHGKKNPNEGWVKGGVELVAMHLSQQLGGAPIKWETI